MVNYRGRKAIFAFTFLLVIVAFVSFGFFWNQTNNQRKTVNYWILNISTNQTLSATAGHVVPNGTAYVRGHVIPNGTVYVPLNETGISVTANPTGYSGFLYWILDGVKHNNSGYSGYPSSIFVPRQQANSSHTLEAYFEVFDPPQSPIITDFPSNQWEITVNADSYRAYNFSFPSGSIGGGAYGFFEAYENNSNDIAVYVMDSANFTYWQNSLGQQNNGASPFMYYDSGKVANGTISVFLPTEGTYFLVFDNLDGASKQSFYYSLGYWWIPGN